MRAGAVRGLRRDRTGLAVVVAVVAAEGSRSWIVEAVAVAVAVVVVDSRSWRLAAMDSPCIAFAFVIVGSRSLVG